MFHHGKFFYFYHCKSKSTALQLNYLVIEGNIGKIPPEVLNSIALSIALDLESIMVRIAAILTVLEEPEQYHRIKKEKLAKLGKEIYLPLAMKLGMGGIERMRLWLDRPVVAQRRRPGLVQSE